MTNPNPALQIRYGRESQPKYDRITVRNVTLDKLVISYPGTNSYPGTKKKKLTLAPLEEKTMLDLPPKEQSELVDELEKWQQNGYVRTTKVRSVLDKEPDRSVLGGFIALFVVLGLIAAGVLGLVNILVNFNSGWYLAPFVPAALMGIIMGLQSLVQKVAKKSSTMRLARFFQALWRRLTQLVTLVASLAITVGIPMATIMLTRPASSDSKHKDFDVEILTGPHLPLRLALVVIASSLPALLFFSRAEYRLRTLRERFFRDVMHLDPRIETLDDLSARYDEEMKEVFGQRVYDAEIARHRSTVPVLGTTLVLTLGWTLALLYRVDANGVSMPLTNALDVPSPSPVIWAFLGAYFFGLNLVLRGHLRDDLDIKSFTTISVRVMLVLGPAWLMTYVQHPSRWIVSQDGLTASVIAFSLGVFPESWLIWLQEQLRSRLRLDTRDKGLVELSPLTKLEGIDLYDRSRLANEGINNVEALAHSDLIGLLLRTRIPASRLVDWLDQAILYLHTRNERTGETSLYDRLRAVGIRTATDLERAYFGLASIESTLDGRPPPFDANEEHVHTARADLAEIVAGTREEGGHGRLLILWRAIADDEWLSFVRCRQTRLSKNTTSRTVPEPKEPPTTDEKSTVESAPGFDGAADVEVA